jgi:KTSC domain
MEHKRLNSMLLKSAGYDATLQRLELDYANGERRVFKAVPAEVYRRLIAAPNPAAYYEDRIAEEYVWEKPAAGGVSTARSKLDSLFGSNDSASKA